MNIESIDKVMRSYVDTGEMAGGILIIHKDGKLIYRNKWGYTDQAKENPVEYNTIFRMASMSKVLTVVGLMKLYDKGKIALDDKVSKYLPEFSSLSVVSDKRFEGMEAFQKYMIYGEKAPLDEVETVESERQLTIRDLLTHSSGLEMGVYGILKRIELSDQNDTLASRCEKMSKLALDFQPGKGTGYSPLANFDLLARIIEVISGMKFDEYMKKELFLPLDMKDACFHFSQEQKTRLIPLYKPENGEQVDVSGSHEDINGIGSIGPNYMSGAAGVYCTADDYDHFTQMLYNNGSYQDIEILKPETVKLIHTETAYTTLEPDPGMEWALGVKIRKDPKKANSPASVGTYGWSGAFGTHFFISPQDRLAVTFVMNRADIGGSGSYISKKVEELVFDKTGTPLTDSLTGALKGNYDDKEARAERM